MSVWLPRPARLRAARTRLALESLEDRATPAVDLWIDGGADATDTSANVSSVTVAGVTTFTPNNLGQAVLDVDAIETALAAGNDVVVTTGPLGTQLGEIIWAFTDANDNLVYTGNSSQKLSLITDGSSILGNVTLDGVHLALKGLVSVNIDTTAPATNGKITFSNGAMIGLPGDEAASIALNAGKGDINLTGVLSAGTGNIISSAGVLSPKDGAIQSNSGDITINAVVDLGNSFSFNGANVTLNQKLFGNGNNLSVNAFNGTATLGGTVDGLSTLTLSGSTGVLINSDIGSFSAPQVINFNGGPVTFGANNITAGTVNVNGGVFGAGSGTVTANLFQVNSGAVLAPGGSGAVGQLNIKGLLQLNLGSILEIDLIGNGVDQLIANAANLGPGTLVITGPDSLAAPATIVSTPAGLFAGFDSAFMLKGSQVIAVQSNVGPNGSVVISPAAAAVGGTAKGSDLDGTSYTARLTGPGTLYLSDGAILAKDTTSKSNLMVTTKANGSDDFAELKSVTVFGSLGALTASKARLLFGFTATGAVRSITVDTVSTQLRLETAAGGPTTTRTTVAGNEIFADVEAKGTLSSLTTKGNFFGGVTADALGTVRVTGTLQTIAAPWTITNGITSLSADVVGGFAGFNLSAKYLGSMTVGAGGITGANVVLTGANLGYGLRSLTVKGTVQTSTLDVRGGNVGNVTVGRFINSNLWVGYNGNVAFDDVATAGQFTGAFKLSSFKTTATTIGDPTHPLNWAFAGSRVVSDSIGTVRLTGLNTTNGTVAFGFKTQTAGGSVRTASAGKGAVPLNVDLTAANATVDDLKFLDV